MRSHQTGGSGTRKERSCVPPWLRRLLFPLACSRCLLSLTLGSVDGPWLFVHGFSSRYCSPRLAFSHSFVYLHIHISCAFTPMGNAITCTLSFMQLYIGSIMQLSLSPQPSCRLVWPRSASSMVTVPRHPMPRRTRRRSYLQRGRPRGGRCSLFSLVSWRSELLAPEGHRDLFQPV